MNTINKIRTFVKSNFYVPDDVTLSDDSSLLGLGIVDSTGVLEIVQFVEASFGVAVDDLEIVPENLDSVAQIARFVASKQRPERRSA
jgi:acyl carrier protein